MNLNRILKASIMLACALVQVHAMNPGLSSTTDTDDIVEFTHPTNQQKFRTSRSVLESKYPNSMLHLLANPRGAGDMQRSLTLDKTPEGHEQYLPDAVNYINSGGFPVDKDNHSLMAALHYYGALTPQAFKEYEWSLEYRQHHDVLVQKINDLVNPGIDKIFETFIPNFLQNFKQVTDYRQLKPDRLCLRVHTEDDEQRYLETRTSEQRLRERLVLNALGLQNDDYRTLEQRVQRMNVQDIMSLRSTLAGGVNMDQQVQDYFAESIKIDAELLDDQDIFKSRLLTRLNQLFPGVTWSLTDKEYQSLYACPNIEIN